VIALERHKGTDSERRAESVTLSPLVDADDLVFPDDACSGEADLSGVLVVVEDRVVVLRARLGRPGVVPAIFDADAGVDRVVAQDAPVADGGIRVWSCARWALGARR
jgi:hypothetical protein